MVSFKTHGAMNVLVNGIGNIGSTVLQVLVKYKQELGISTIYANKNLLKPWQHQEMDFLRKQGIVLTSPKAQVGFELLENVVQHINYIFECGANGAGLRNKSFYESFPNLMGACAQGSEKGFGISYMAGVADDLIRSKKWVHIVSCNTHGTASILSTLAGNKLENLVSADCVVVRRSEDLGNHERLVSANVVARHLDPTIGTHHAVDVIDMYKQLGVQCALTSSDITTPSQLMHAVRFNVTLKFPLTKSEIDERWMQNSFLAKTTKFDSNVVFELGRRYGLNGRIFSHAIVISENVMIHQNTIKGWAFVPQEGNTILSSIHAFLLQTNHSDCSRISEQLKVDLLQSVW